MAQRNTLEVEIHADDYYQVFEDVKDELRIHDESDPSENYDIQHIAELANIHCSTLYKWIGDNPPRSPLMRTIHAVAEVLGFEIRLVKKDGTKRRKKRSRKHLEVVK
ncbi:MAG: hypothetical protein JAY90_18630 [Candidatus Thiodiazotropha lotti]|nr:hypothetical protein [Candidatus Thiodiazotropha lotti]